MSEEGLLQGLEPFMRTKVKATTKLNMGRRSQQSQDHVVAYLVI